MNTVIKILSAVVVLAVLSGCVAQSNVDAGQHEPTHRWITQMEVSRAKYNFDNKACTDEAMLNIETARESDPEFVTYERCMAKKGYSLATY